MAIRKVPTGYEVTSRDQYGVRRRRIFKTMALAQAYEESIRRKS